MLGVFLNEPEKLILELDDETAEEIRANMEMGLPPLMYREAEIKDSLQRVLTLYMKRIETADSEEHSSEPESEFEIPEI